MNNIIAAVIVAVGMVIGGQLTATALITPVGSGGCPKPAPARRA